MIDLYTWKTSNGRKATIMLEECGLAYNLHPINIGQGDQFTPEFIAINPNSKIPAMIDDEGPNGEPYTMIESGAMLMYLAEKTGKFMPSEMAARYEVIQWLMFQIGGIGRSSARCTTSSGRRAKRCPTPSTATSPNASGSTAC